MGRRLRLGWLRLLTANKPCHLPQFPAMVVSATLGHQGIPRPIWHGTRFMWSPLAAGNRNNLREPHKRGNSILPGTMALYQETQTYLAQRVY
jgi:hypothetical protein